MTHTIRPDIQPLPPSMAHLPISERGFPTPWFVHIQDDGTPEFRIIGRGKMEDAVEKHLCWVCGLPMVKGHNLYFPVGPMCGINRTTAEPPSHKVCALYSIVNCPFLSKPQMVRREGGLPEERKSPGEMIARNPGVTLLWGTKEYMLFNDGKGGALFRLGHPVSLDWFCQGRAATRDEVSHSVTTGLPFLEQMIDTHPLQDDRDREREDLRSRLAWITTKFPKV